MVKTKKTSPPAEERRTSARLAGKIKTTPPEKKKPIKKVAKAKKANQTENGNTKAEEPKAEATDAK